jgi:hypothetical protein
MKQRLFSYLLYAIRPLYYLFCLFIGKNRLAYGRIVSIIPIMHDDKLQSLAFLLACLLKRIVGMD